MAGFSPSTYSLLYKKIKSVATGVKSVNADPTNPNNIIFTLHDNSKITISLSKFISFKSNSSLILSKRLSKPILFKADIFIVFSLKSLKFGFSSLIFCSKSVLFKTIIDFLFFAIFKILFLAYL